MHVALRMFIMQVLASKLHFLANINAQLAVTPLFWTVNCINIGGPVALLSCPSIYFLFYAKSLSFEAIVCSQLQIWCHINGFVQQYLHTNFDSNAYV